MSLTDFLNSTWTFLLAGALIGAAGAACDPKTIGDETAGNGVCEDGDMKPAEDGCNTCTCTDGTWACTEKACDEPECEEGETKPAGDGCNTCGCVDGMWACTLIGCGETTTDAPPECMEGETMPAGDGCNTCTCTDGTWACTEEACNACGNGVVEAGEGCDDGNVTPGDGCDATCQLEADPDAIQICDEDAPADPHSISSAAIDGDSLLVEVSAGGGCAEHEFLYCWDGLFLESFPVQVHTRVSHEDNDDPCDAIIMESLKLDLTPLKSEYQKAYQTQTGEISIHLEGWMDGPLLYSF